MIREIRNTCTFFCLHVSILGEALSDQLITSTKVGSASGRNRGPGGAIGADLGRAKEMPCGAFPCVRGVRCQVST